MKDVIKRHPYRSLSRFGILTTLALLLCCLSLPAAETTDTPGAGARADKKAEQKVTSLVVKLGASSFKERKAAEEELSKCERYALPILYEALASDDPEVQTRVKRIINVILSDPNRIPSSFFEFDVEADNENARQQEWKASYSNWISHASVIASQTNGTSITSGYFAQSFIPHTNKITAVSFGCYPVNFDLGWIALEIRSDQDGRPGPMVLSRCWINVAKTCPVRHGTYMPFDLPDIIVDPEKTYWFCFYEHSDRAGANLTNFGFSGNNDYKEGMAICGISGMPSRTEDAKFLIISDCDPVRGLKKASEEAKKTIPSSVPEYHDNRLNNTYQFHNHAMPIQFQEIRRF